MSSAADQTQLDASRRSSSGRYELLQKLGSGGMGTVYLARQHGVGNKVALKFLAPQLSNDEHVVQRFLQEGRVNVEVTHPGAAQLLDMGRDEQGQLFLAFEYVEGHDVRELLTTEGRLSFAEARQIALRVAEVLAHAHARGIIHRDIKPENIRVRRDLAGLHVKVLDFGIARLVTGANAGRLTVDGALTGTPRYMAPEQISATEVDARTDVYALGLVFFEMLTGAPAFSGAHVPQLFLRQLQEPVPRLESVNPTFKSAPLDAFIARACAKDRALRFPDMQRFLEALRALPDPNWPEPRPGAPVAPDPPAPPAPPRELATPMPVPPSARPSALGPVLMAAALLLAGGAVTVALRLRSSVGPLVAPGSCPELVGLDPALTSLDVPTLEARIRAMHIFMPSQVEDQVRALRAFAERYTGDRRDCMYRLSLVNFVANEKVVMSNPNFWGYEKEPKDLALLFLELPLTQKWTVDQRKSVLLQVEDLFIANLTKKVPADAEYWRRMYYGTLIRCEVTDAVLAELKAERPQSCLGVVPK